MMERGASFRVRTYDDWSKQAITALDAGECWKPGDGFRLLHFTLTSGVVPDDTMNKSTLSPAIIIMQGMGMFSSHYILLLFRVKFE